MREKKRELSKDEQFEERQRDSAVAWWGNSAVCCRILLGRYATSGSVSQVKRQVSIGAYEVDWIINTANTRCPCVTTTSWDKQLSGAKMLVQPKGDSSVIWKAVQFTEKYRDSGSISPKTTYKQPAKTIYTSSIRSLRSTSDKDIVHPGEKSTRRSDVLCMCADAVSFASAALSMASWIKGKVQ